MRVGESKKRLGKEQGGIRKTEKKQESIENTKS